MFVLRMKRMLNRDDGESSGFSSRFFMLLFLTKPRNRFSRSIPCKGDLATQTKG